MFAARKASGNHRQLNIPQCRVSVVFRLAEEYTSVRLSIRAVFVRINLFVFHFSDITLQAFFLSFFVGGLELQLPKQRSADYTAICLSICGSCRGIPVAFFSGQLVALPRWWEKLSAK